MRRIGLPMAVNSEETWLLIFPRFPAARAGGFDTRLLVASLDYCIYQSNRKGAAQSPLRTRVWEMTKTTGRSAPADFQEHLARLEERGLLVRIDRPINKDTELHPLMRWQFVGGYPESERKAFLFTNVVGSRGEKYDMPVVCCALAGSEEIYAAGMGVPVEELGDIWMHAIDMPNLLVINLFDILNVQQFQSMILLEIFVY